MDLNIIGGKYGQQLQLSLEVEVEEPTTNQHQE